MENIYNRAKIYRIVCNTTGKTYYGSTCEATLAKRLAHHMSHYRLWKDNKCGYTSSYEIFENNNYEIILCESVKCESKDELRMAERKWIENNECVNRYNPIRTENENLTIRREYAAKYQHDNRDIINTKALKYYDDNRKIICEKKKIKTVCECGCEVRKHDLQRHKRSQKHIKLMENK